MALHSFSIQSQRLDMRYKMMKITRLLLVASAAFFIAGSAVAQQGGTVTKNAFAIGKGAGTQGYTSLLCASAQLAVGQSAADPICRTLTGDVTLSAAGVTSIGSLKILTGMMANNAVTLAKIATISTGRVLCNVTGGASVPVECTATQITALINSFTATLSGAVPSPGTATGKYLRDDATWQTIAGSGTVTQITCGTGLDGGVITTTGTCSLSAARRTLPTTQVFTSGSGTYTLPANALWVEVFLQGGGGGGGGGANNGIAPSGAATCWNTTGSACTTPVFSAGGGTGGTATNPGTSTPGGTISGSGTCIVGIAGSDGGGGLFSVAAVNGAPGGGGGVSTYGGAGAGLYAAAGSAAKANSGSGGGGGGTSAAASSNTASGGGAGAYCYSIIGTPGSTYTYTVGTGGTGATAGTNGSAGGNGAAGRITVIEHYGT